jgi:nucleotide-binding universal stress UspA family protein
MNALFSRILVGVEDSEPSRDAVALAARLAQEHGGRLALCHAVNWRPMIAEIASTGAVVDPDPIVDELRAAGEAALARAGRIAADAGVAAEPHRFEGDPAEAIVGFAAENGCSLIVMGTHGRKGLGHLVLGSTTEAVLRYSTIPVLTVHAGAKLAAAARRCFERIVVGVDDSQPSDAAIETIVDLPTEDRREVIFCSAADGQDVIGGRGYYYAEVHEALHEHAQYVVDKAVALARAHGVAAEGRVVDGSAERALIDAATDRSADLIVLGSHGRRGMRRFFLGSVAESVVRSALIPVLVARTAAARV